MNDDAEDPDLLSDEYPVREDMTCQLKVWRLERYDLYLLVILVVLGLAMRGLGLLDARDIRS